MSHEFLRNIVRCPCSPVSNASENNEAVDMSELSKQLEKLRLNCMQQKANVSSDKPQPGYNDNYMPELCGLFDKISADDEDDMFGWQGKPESNERDDDDSINFRELFRELGSRKMNHSSPQSSRCQKEVKVEEAATEEEVVVIGSDTEEKDDAAVVSTESISSITTSLNIEKAEASSLSSACAFPFHIVECCGDQKTTKLVTMGFMGNKEREAYRYAFKASAQHKPGFKRAGKRRPEYHFRLQRKRRQNISEKLQCSQDMIPWRKGESSKNDKLLNEIITYTKYLQNHIGFSLANAVPRQDPVPESNYMRNYLVANANDEHPAYVGLTDANFGHYALNPAQQATVSANYTPERQMPFQFVPQIAPPREFQPLLLCPPQNNPYMFFQDEDIIWDTQSLSLHYQWLLSQTRSAI